ncbi:MAG: peptide ABC transporter substrate-binding protein [Sphaerobacter sp.]|nr:peptide ABC transporter substrate-binding protein [Sphaerobacter sp.]
MSDRQFDEMLRAATEGRLSRREVLKRAAALGLSAPAIAALLAACGGGGESEPTTAPTQASGGGAASPTASGGSATPQGGSGGEAGGHGELRLLWWQAPTILNAHLSQGTKDFDASRVHLEPLAEFDKDSNLVPVLAAEIPERGKGVAEDGKSVTWKLRQGVKWHDGEEFTAEDVKFTFEYLTNEKTAATTYGKYKNVESVEVIDEYTVKVNFKTPDPAWFNPFVGPEGMILPEHVLRDYVGEKAREAPFNLKPIGTGPFKVVEFRPGDVVVYERNPDYWDPGKPHFDRITMKGGGDATSAARAVLQTGEADYAWNIQVEPAVLKSLEAAGQGKVLTWVGGGTEKLLINHSDPNTEVNGERSYYKNPHPHFKELKVRQALALAIQRDVIADTLYGPGGSATALTMNEVPPLMPDDLTWEFNLDKAKALLDEVGAQPGSNGIRVLNDVPMHWVYQTSVNPVRQKTQELIKAACAQLGIEIEIKAVSADVYFSGDPGNPDTTGHFYADLEMYTNGAESPYPVLWYRRYYSGNPDTDICQQSNQWAADNDMRYQNPEFNKLWDQVTQELDPDRATELFLEMQRLVVNDVAEIGIVARNNVACVSNQITGISPTQWASDLWDVKNWKKA